MKKTRSNDSPWFHIARSATKIDNTRENYSQHNHVAVNLPLTLCLITSSYTRGTDYSSDSIKTSCIRNKVLLQLWLQLQFFKLKIIKYKWCYIIVYIIVRPNNTYNREQVDSLWKNKSKVWNKMVSFEILVYEQIDFENLSTWLIPD